eukprot:TRINITY_DN722_c0_g1_i8.p1 TRINITY_DN722_c0_g1~~TRINITY_DN722_c0_g1_i8.p1  ORF type:complete len:578 (-),score=132.97 TRINITY_DN722_c0_g1_i8:99-1787(-)
MSQKICIVNGELRFMDSKDDDRQMNILGDFKKRNMDYSVVGVLGIQSSAKSTVLNATFGTSFETKAQGNLDQKTQGIWIAMADKKLVGQRNILIMDVEGTDAEERGDRAAEYAKKTSLFSLVMADVLVINMRQDAVGLLQGGNLVLLETIFEKNLTLFAEQGGRKRHLMFLIRDINKHAKKDYLQGKVMGSINRIWSDVTKTGKFAGARLDQFYDLSFEFLHNQIDEENQHEVGNLREKFTDILLQRYKARDIPASDFFLFARSIWNKINLDKELNIGSERKMLAEFQCRKISDRCFTSFSMGLKAITNETEATRFSSKILSDFDSETAYYDQSIVSKSKTKLRSNITAKLQEHKEVQLEKQRQQELEKKREEEIAKMRKAQAEIERQARLERQRQQDLEKKREEEIAQMKRDQIEMERKAEIERQRQQELERQREEDNQRLREQMRREQQEFRRQQEKMQKKIDQAKKDKAEENKAIIAAKKKEAENTNKLITGGGLVVGAALGVAAIATAPATAIPAAVASLGSWLFPTSATVGAMVGKVMSEVGKDYWRSSTDVKEDGN